MPRNISDALTATGNTMPLIAFLSPDGGTNFGSFEKKALNSQKYNTIFRDVKKKIKEAQEAGKLRNSGLVAKSDASDDKEADSDAVMIAGPRFRTWKSSKGSEIKAKLIKFEGDTFHLKTTKGKTIKVTASDLDPESVKTAEELVRINKK